MKVGAGIGFLKKSKIMSGKGKRLNNNSHEDHKLTRIIPISKTKRRISNNRKRISKIRTRGTETAESIVEDTCKSKREKKNKK